MPLLVAARNGHESIVKLLVESGAGVNTQVSIELWLWSLVNTIDCIIYLILLHVVK